MKQDFNNSMDSLLRDYALQHAAREAAAQDDATPFEQGANAQHSVEHPDADELAAFAENALPEKARARTVAHLADCSACRSFVVDLTRGENFVQEPTTQLLPQKSVALPHTSWRERLTALFAFPSLRFVAPALAAILLFVFIIGIAVNRRQSETNLVASKYEPQTNVRPAESETNETTSLGNTNSTASSIVQPPDSQAMSNTATTTTTTTTTTNASTRARPTGNANSSITPKETQTSVAMQNNNVQGNAPRPAYSTQSPPSAPTMNGSDENSGAAGRNRSRAIGGSIAPSASYTANSNANMSGNRATVTSTQSETPSTNFSASAKAAKNSASDADDSIAASDSPFAQARAAERRRSMPAASATKSESKSDKRALNRADAGSMMASSSSPTLRSVNGRDFRRQKSGWIDTAYAASQSTINIARGSKQFRRLVSEEPGIKTIAAQLDGEIILVWKGRAYRIH